MWVFGESLPGTGDQICSAAKVRPQHPIVLSEQISSKLNMLLTQIGHIATDSNHLLVPLSEDLLQGMGKAFAKSSTLLPAFVHNQAGQPSSAGRAPGMIAQVLQYGFVAQRR